MESNAWWEENLALRERMKFGREMRGITIPEMAKLTRISTALVEWLEDSPVCVTHPKIAARVLAECLITDQSMLKHLTAKCRWEHLPKIPRRKSDSVLAKMRMAEVANREAELRERAMIESEKLRIESEIRHNEFAAFWAACHLHGERAKVPLKLDVIDMIVKARGWAEDVVSYKLGWLQVDSYKKLCTAGTASRTRCELLSIALGCELEDIVDIEKLKKMMKARGVRR